MGSRFDLRLLPTLFAEPYCNGCPLRNICHAEHTQMSCTELGAAHGSVLHITSPDFLERLGEVNGFEFNVKALPQSCPVLPAYVPALRPGKWSARQLTVDVGAVAIPLTSVEALARLTAQLGITARQLVGISDDQQLIVLGFAHDRYLELQWPSHRRHQLLLAIKHLRPDAAVAWNYSVWHRHSSGWVYPRAEQLYNLKRSLKVFAEMQQFGIPAIPHFYWGMMEDLDRWVEWLAQNPSVSTLSVDLQTLDSSKAWSQALDMLNRFRSLLPRHVAMLFSGVCSVSRVLELRTVWPESSLTNLGADFGSTRLGHERCYGLHRPWFSDPDAWPRADRFNEISRQYTHLFGGEQHQAVGRSSVA